jgi:hypothetical protein
MTRLAAALRVLLGLFVEDGGLALAILVMVVVAWLVSALSPEVPLATGTVLVIGCLGTLFANVMKAAQSRAEPTGGS